MEKGEGFGSFWGGWNGDGIGLGILALGFGFGFGIGFWDFI